MGKAGEAVTAVGLFRERKVRRVNERRCQGRPRHGRTGVTDRQGHGAEPSDTAFPLVYQERPEHAANPGRLTAGNVQIRGQVAGDIINTDVQARVGFLANRRALDGKAKGQEGHTAAVVNFSRQRVIVVNNIQRLGLSVFIQEFRVVQLDGVERDPGVIGVGVGFFLGGGHCFYDSMVNTFRLVRPFPFIRGVNCFW